MRGSKSCPKCNNSVGPRTRICPSCNFEFAFKVKIHPMLNNVPTVSLPRVVDTHDISPPMPQGTANGGMLILVPAGRCPVPYRGNWEEWVDGLKSHANKLGVSYSVGVFTYWAHAEGYADKFTDEGKTNLKLIERIAQNEN